MEPAFVDRKTLRVHVGGRDSFQRAAGGGPRLHPGDHGSDGRWEEGIGGRSRRRAGERTILAGGADRLENARVEERAGAGDWRWSVGILGRAAASVFEMQNTALLGSQDGERTEQIAEDIAAVSEEHAAPNLDGRHAQER